MRFIKVCVCVSVCVITVMEILNGNDIRSKTAGSNASDSPMQTRALTPCSCFGFSK